MSDENALEAMSLLTHEQREIRIIHPADQIKVEVEHAEVIVPPTEEQGQAQAAAFGGQPNDEEALGDEGALTGVLMSIKGLEACYLSIKPNKRAEEEEDELERELAKKHQNDPEDE